MYSHPAEFPTSTRAPTKAGAAVDPPLLRNNGLSPARTAVLLGLPDTADMSVRN